jgi:hypothetical protein
MHSLNENVVPQHETRLFWKQLGKRDAKGEFSKYLDVHVYDREATLKLDGLNTIYELNVMDELSFSLSGKSLVLIGDLEEKRKRDMC